MNTLPVNITSKLMQLIFYAVKLIIGLLVYYQAGLAINLHEARDLQRIIRRALRLQPIN